MAKLPDKVPVKLLINEIIYDEEQMEAFAEALEKVLAKRFQKGIGMAPALDIRYERRK
jgi:hypothetical protein